MQEPAAQMGRPKFTRALKDDWKELFTARRLQSGKNYSQISLETGLHESTVAKAFQSGCTKENMEKICASIGMAIEEMYR